MTRFSESALYAAASAFLSFISPITPYCCRLYILVSVLSVELSYITTSVITCCVPMYTKRLSFLNVTVPFMSAEIYLDIRKVHNDGKQKYVIHHFHQIH